jgi:hypothetical protein
MRFCQAVAGLGFKVTLHQSSILQGCTLSGLCATHNKHGLMNNAIHLRSFLYYVFSFPLGSLFAVSISFTCDETLMSGGGDCSTKVLGGLHLWYYHLFPLWWKKCREQEKLFILLQCVKSNQHYAVMHGWWQSLWEISFLDTCVWSCYTFRLVCAPICFPYCLCGFGMSIFPLAMVAITFMLIFRIFLARVKQLERPWVIGCIVFNRSIRST